MAMTPIARMRNRLVEGQEEEEQGVCEREGVKRRNTTKEKVEKKSETAEDGSVRLGSFYLFSPSSPPCHTPLFRLCSHSLFSFHSRCQQTQSRCPPARAV